MEEIIKKLEEIVSKELDKKTIPSREVLDIVNIIAAYYFAK